jgi:hypothetical protein
MGTGRNRREENRMKQLFDLLRTRFQRSKTKPEEPSSRASVRLPPELDQLRKAATSALKSSRRTNPLRVPGPEQAGDDALITVMKATADPKKTAAVYFAMSEAMERDGRFSDHDKAEAEALCRAFGHEPLTDEERQAIALLARKRYVRNGG